MATKQRSADASGTESTTRTDLYSRITAKIVADLNKACGPGTGPGEQPFACVGDNDDSLPQAVVRDARHGYVLPTQGGCRAAAIRLRKSRDD